ncbi:hypothetical protein BN13_1590003 [Nostocoides jenkinsii Ben 74]|uniref:Uncharacterized protein n=2 Tax=Nostocoides jenkinsii TaxID=330834 RepID=A0A077M4V6_9MICO|nr:hypothetical protein BN13_1590003 [Tetrasphaera jenkinsii Ben 74]
MAIPMRRPAIWLEVAMATLAAGCAWAMEYGVLRLLRGDGDGKAVLGIVILAALGALFTAATVGAHRLRQGPARELTVTAEGITTPTGGYAWDDIVAIRASSYLPQGGLRKRNLIVVELHTDARTPLQQDANLGRIGRAIDRATHHSFRLVAAEDLDVDPWKVIRALQALAADPALRARLAGPDGPALIQSQPGMG